MAICYLHAGLPKTGTTAIQKWLARNTEGLRRAGAFSFGATHYAHRLAVAAITDPVRLAEPDIPPLVRTDLAQVLNELRQAANDDKTRCIVISSEYFSIADPLSVKRIFSENDVCEVKILFMLRRQDRYIESNYNQLIRMMSWVSPIGRPLYHSGYDWNVLTSTWANAFGRESIILGLYDEFDLAGGGLVSQVFRLVDPALAQVARELAPVDERINPSLPAALIEFKRLANSAGANDVLPLLEMASQRGLGGPPFRMEREVAKKFLDVYRESNRKVAREFFNRDGDLFDESDLDVESSAADCTGNLPVETLAMLFALHLQEQAEQTRRLNKAIEQLTVDVNAAFRKLGKPQED